jgi:hypothetical protein
MKCKKESSEQGHLMWINNTIVALIITMHILFFYYKNYVPMLNDFHPVSPIGPESVLDPRLTLTMKEIKTYHEIEHTIM